MIIELTISDKKIMRGPNHTVIVLSEHVNRCKKSEKVKLTLLNTPDNFPKTKHQNTTRHHHDMNTRKQNFKIEKLTMWKVVNHAYESFLSLC